MYSYVHASDLGGQFLHKSLAGFGMVRGRGRGPFATVRITLSGTPPVAKGRRPRGACHIAPGLKEAYSTAILLEVLHA